MRAKKHTVVEYIHTDLDMDSSKPLSEWLELFNELRELYGADTHMALDAGYNNISCVIVKKTSNGVK